MFKAGDARSPRIDDISRVGQAAMLGMEAVEALEGGQHVAWLSMDDQLTVDRAAPDRWQ